MFLVSSEKAKKKKSQKEHTSPLSPVTSVELAAAGSLDGLHTWPQAAGPTGNPTSWVDVTGLNPGDGCAPRGKVYTTEAVPGKPFLFFFFARELVRSGSYNKIP